MIDHSKGPKMGLLRALLMMCLLVGYINTQSEKDFGFDDEDMLGSSGEGSGETTEEVDKGTVTLTKPTGVPALYRAIINVTSVVYTDEIAAAGRDISNLAVTQRLQEAIQRLLNTLPGTIRIRIVDLQPGSLMVTFDIDTDGQQTEEEILALLNDALKQGSVSGFRVSDVGFDFRRIRDDVTCSPAIGREPTSLPEQGNIQANLMVNFQFPCDGYVVGWRYYRSMYYGETIVGVFRQISDTEFALVAKTILPATNNVGIYTTKPDEPILVQKGYFIGIFHPQDSAGSVIPFARSGSDATIPDTELYQNYYLSDLYESDLVQDRPFKINDMVYSENQLTYALQAEMSYVNVPKRGDTSPPIRACTADEWTCSNGECVPAQYRCDTQRDCYDGSDEDNCPAPSCPNGEFQCADRQQCLPMEFVCNFVSDCGDGSDELNCGPAPVIIISFRQGTQPSSFMVSWIRPQQGGSAIVNYNLKYRKVSVRSDTTLDGDYIVQSPLEPFQTVTVNADQDKYILSDLEAGSYYEVEMRAMNAIGESEPRSFVFQTASAGCVPGEWQCRDGGCISLEARCDAWPGDCADDSDEDGCDDQLRCSEGQVVCRLPDGTEVCRNDAVGCVVACRENQFQCLDGLKCISFGMLCDGRVDCNDYSDENNCECAEGEFQCVAGRQCISGNLRCDGNNDCDDSSDEENCPCPPGTFQCTGRRSQCVTEALVCDGARDCDDGSDELNCPTTPIPGCGPGLWGCADGSCIPVRMRCDGVPQCEDSSDEVRCPVPTAPRRLVATVLEYEYPVVELTWEEPENTNGVLTRYKLSWRKSGDQAYQELQFNPDTRTFTTENLDHSTRYQFQVQASNRIGFGDTASVTIDTPAPRGCGAGLWGCADGSCIPDRMRCDGVPQCEDSSDEVGCPSRGCRRDQFTCADGKCIEREMRCDFIPHCEDSSDEDNCPCRDGMFQCRDGLCVEGSMKCDGVPQCEDGSDEENCPAANCPSSDFQCASTSLGQIIECIDKRLRCDSYVDCSDGSDELDCPGCRANEFTCERDGRCVPEAARCNGSIECGDRSDELNCVCTANQFRCGDGLCIDLARRCNREVDCSDQSDELACPCRSGEFQCLNGECISEELRCNNQLDCRDRSDEQNCPRERTCPEGYYMCGTGHCLSLPRRCDGRSDCPDGSDERNCSLRCAADEIECVADNKCLTADQICNRVYDCSDRRDELNCARCTQNEFQCNSDRSCISAAGRCNGRKECSDGSDEMNCPTLPPISVEVSPKNLRIRAGAEAIIICSAQGLPQGARLEWVRRGGELPMQSAVEVGKLMIPVAKPMDSGDYVCQVVGVPGSFEDSARLEVVAVGPQPTPSPGRCGRDEAVCQNGQCIRREYRCDGEPDCTDGSDEPPECFGNLCEPNEFQCPSSGQCVMKIWRCDGENDCEDGFDESDCAAKDPDAPCGYDEYQCLSGDQCIPLAYQCDQEIDCLDRSDEIGCSPPIITLPPVAEIEVELGATFTIICEAVGVPMPLIVWRLNWGNIPTGERVSTTSSDGRGVLTITDARYEDAGAYTCEAINNRGSIFAVPDALVIVTRQPAVTREFQVDIDVPITHEEIPIHTERIFTIGGASDVHLNTDEDFVLISHQGNCQRDLNISLEGPKLTTNCRQSKQAIELAYVGGERVNFEIAKKLIKIPRRGDIIPEPLNDTTMVFIGGLTADVKETVKDIQIVQNVSVTSIQTKILELQGDNRQPSNTEKQMIYIGVNQECGGQLVLKDVIDGKELQCVTNVTRELVKTEITIHGNSEGTLVEKSIINTADRTIILQGDDSMSKETIQPTGTDQIIERFSNDKAAVVIEKEADNDKQISIQEKIKQDGFSKTILPGNKSKILLEEIIGDIFKITNSSHVNIHSGHKYVELGLGSPCLTPIEVTFVGASIISSCQGHTTNITYTGQDEADFEFVREIILLSDSRDWSKYQKEDFIIVYMGELPNQIRKKADEIISVKHIKSIQDIHSNIDIEKTVQIFKNSGPYRHHRNQRQILLISVNKICKHNLVLSKFVDQDIVKCEKPDSDKKLSMNFGSFILEDRDILNDNFEELEEPLLMIYGSDHVHFKSEELVDVQFRWNCFDDYVLTTFGNNFSLTCAEGKQFINFMYVGKHPSDMYISKFILNEVKSENITNPNSNHISLYIGDNVDKTFERKRMVELISDIHNPMQNMKERSVQFIGQNNSINVHRVSVFELGLTGYCNGTFAIKTLKGIFILYCKQHTPNLNTTQLDIAHSNTVELNRNIDDVIENELEIDNTFSDIASDVPTRRSDILIEESSLVDELKDNQLDIIKPLTDLDYSKAKQIEIIEVDSISQGKNKNEKRASLSKPNIEIGVEKAETKNSESNVIEIDIFSHKEVIDDKNIKTLPEPKISLERENHDRKSEFHTSTPSLEHIELATLHYTHETVHSEVIERDPGASHKDNIGVHGEVVIISGGNSADPSKQNVIITGKSDDQSDNVTSNNAESTTLRNVDLDRNENDIHRLDVNLELDKVYSVVPNVKELVSEKKSDQGFVNHKRDIIDVDDLLTATTENSISKYESKETPLYEEDTKVLSENMRQNTLFGVLAGESRQSIINERREETVILSGKTPVNVLPGETDNNQIVKPSTVITELNVAGVQHSHERTEKPNVVTGVQHSHDIAEKPTVTIGSVTKEIQPNNDIKAGETVIITGHSPVDTFTSSDTGLKVNTIHSDIDVKPAPTTTPIPTLIHDLHFNVPDINNKLDDHISELSEKIFTINRTIEYVTINQTEESVQIDLQDKCNSNYSVMKLGDKLSVSCTDSLVTLEISLVGVKEELIDVKTTAKEVIGKPKSKDMVQIYLSGLGQSLTKPATLDTLKGNSVVYVNMPETIKLTRPSTGGVDDNLIHIVEIGIRQDCRSGSIRKYVDHDGTVIYCRRRSDILPEEYDQSEANEDFFEGKTIINEGSDVERSDGDINTHVEPKPTMEKEIMKLDSTTDKGTGVGNAVGAGHVHLKHGITHIVPTKPSVVVDTRRPEVVVLASKVEHIGSPDMDEINTGNPDSPGIIYSESDITTKKPARRGDINVEGYEDYQNDVNDFFNLKPKGVVISKTPFRNLTNWIMKRRGDKHSQTSPDKSVGEYSKPDSTNGTNVIDMELNKSIDLRLGKNCTGSLEAVEDRDGVIIKGKFGEERFQLHLTGFPKYIDNLQSDGQFNGYMNESPYKGEDKNGTIIVSDKTIKVPDEKHKNKFLTLREVYIASRKRYIEEHHRKYNGKESPNTYMSHTSIERSINPGPNKDKYDTTRGYNRNDGVNNGLYETYKISDAYHVVKDETFTGHQRRDSERNIQTSNVNNNGGMSGQIVSHFIDGQGHIREDIQSDTHVSLDNEQTEGLRDTHIDFVQGHKELSGERTRQKSDRYDRYDHGRNHGQIDRPGNSLPDLNGLRGEKVLEQSDKYDSSVQRGNILNHKAKYDRSISHSNHLLDDLVKGQETSLTGRHKRSVSAMQVKALHSSRYLNQRLSTSIRHNNHSDKKKPVSKDILSYEIHGMSGSRTGYGDIKTLNGNGKDRKDLSGKYHKENTRHASKRKNRRMRLKEKQRKRNKDKNLRTQKRNARKSRKDMHFVRQSTQGVKSKILLALSHKINEGHTVLNDNDFLVNKKVQKWRNKPRYVNEGRNAGGNANVGSGVNVKIIGPNERLKHVKRPAKKIKKIQAIGHSSRRIHSLGRNQDGRKLAFGDSAGLMDNKHIPPMDLDRHTQTDNFVRSGSYTKESLTISNKHEKTPTFLSGRERSDPYKHDSSMDLNRQIKSPIYYDTSGVSDFATEGHYNDLDRRIETSILMGTSTLSTMDTNRHVGSHLGQASSLGQKGPCEPPFFNFGATTRDECVRCFCFGQDVQCFSSDLQVSNIGLVNAVTFNRRDNQVIDDSAISFKASTREYQVVDFSRRLTPGSYYFQLPREFLGERLTSYGGEIKYTIFYDTESRRPAPTSYSDVIITGNGITLYYRARTQPSAGVPTSVSVPLIESAWERYDGTIRGDTPIAQFASREEFMTVLQNVESIQINANYDNRQSIVRVGGVFMSTAVDYSTEFGRAYLVEECQCPTGYTGLSCQTCAAGFTRIQSGGYLGQCSPCNCNGHSNDCDTRTGECLNCQHNTYGPQCQICADGYYGDARGGTPNDCRACPCPLTDPANQFSRTCFLESDGEVTCGNCPLGYEGRRCEKCSEGYNGDPLTPGSTCVKVNVEEICDGRGSLSVNPDPLTRRCRCKENVMGTRCDSCQANTFYLTSNYDLGCIRCFCMGVSKSCQSTYWSRAQTGISFSRDDQGISITDSQGRPISGQRLQVDANNREVIYRNPGGSDIMYWSLPARFLGNKVTAYGGSLRFTMRYSSRQGTAIDSREPFVMITGNEIALIYRQSQTVRPNRPQTFNVVLYEQNWYRADGQPATREHLLMALADLDSILIRGSFEEQQSDVGLRDLTLDVAEDRRTRQDRAYAVEQCVCPVGYQGLSCEDCDTGYTRSGGGLYLGLCEPCNCNGHSNECDPETGVCRNCQHNTAGDYCDRCAVGYYGDATQGRRNDCQKCPCPLTESPNQFSPTCELAADGQVTCTACPAGHTGRRCETCISGYTGNPMKPGDYCRLGPVNTCDCDTRGTVPNTQCNEGTKQCQCKPYTQGLRCARCREGYFYLESNNAQGCLTCYCSGITNQCTSSNYYRDALRPVFGNDGSHNFVLLNRRMNNIISDGFQVDASRNAITFNQFEGIQQERESLFFQLPAKFRGDRVTSYGGYLRFTLEFSARPEGRMSRDVDLEIISDGQALRLYNLFDPALQEGRSQTYEILLRESSFNDLRSNTGPTRATFMTILSNVEGILIRATYHTAMASVTLRDVSMDTAIPTATDLGGAQMVEDCRCPEGYTGLSCQRCAQGYLRVSDGRGGLGRCVKCNCNGHASSCDPDSGRCLDCQHNTEGDRCEVCSAGYYGDATSGTPNDCRKCACPLTSPPNQFSRTCRLAEDNKVTCDRCPTGYTGRQCEKCAQGYTGDPTQPGDSCRPVDSGERPEITVSPIRVEESLGSTAVFQCVVGGPGPFRVVWSRLDSRRLPDRASVNPRYTLTIRDLQPEDTGRYVCDASNAYGVSRGTVTLQVNSGPSPIQVRIENPRVEIDEGRTARLVCTAVSTSRETTYILSWSKQGSQMPAKAIDQNGVLIIPNIQQSDAGNYVCMGSDMFTMDEEIAVLIVSDSGDQAPSVRIEPRYQTVDEGTQARFACVVSGSPKPKIEWYRGGDRQMNPEATISEDGVFIIPRVSQSDESDYYCKATNSIGTTEVRTILYVKLVQQPEITVIVRRTSYIVIAGQTARLECYTDDTTGRITIFWSRPNGLPTGSSQDNGVLTIPDVQKSYAGRYVCTGTDTTTGRINTITTTLEVNVEEATESPTVTVEPEKLTIPMGTTGTLRCVATGTPQPTVTWMKSREELSPNHQVTGNSLRITQASMADRGIYVCRAENSAGMSQDWAVVEVERRMRPKIDIYPNTTQTTVVGGSVLFQCRVMDGDPPPSVTWSRVGGLPLSEKTTVMENGVIMFKDVTQTEQGSYICTATNDMGTITSTVTLTVQGPPSITIQPSQIVYALIGERVTLECTAQGEPTPQVYWVEPTKVRRGDLPPDVQASYPTSEGTAILDIGSVDRDDQGYYKCVASNDGGQSEENVQLVVRESDGGRTAGVRISGPSTLSVVEGQSVELVCSAEAIPGASIRWSRREGALPPGHTVRNGILTIPQFRSEYGGEYICSTVVTTGRFEASVFIIITVAPRLTISPQRVTARAGETIVLSCAASGSGPFDIEWMKVDGQMNPRATERDGTLEIRQATAADAGRYRCVVRSSSAGTSDGYAIVDIEVPPQVVVSDRNVRVTPGNNAELRCTVSGTPAPQVRWDREIGEMPAQHRIQNGILTIYNVQPEDSGRYICTATSSAGSTRDYGVLTVDAGGVINGGVGQRDTQFVNVGDRVSMECIVTGTPLPRITWSRDDGDLPQDAIVGDGVLIIPQAKVEDAGTYTCLAVNEAGSVTSKVTLYVRAEPYVTAPSATTAALGDKVSLVCEARGYPSPDITWTRKDGEMPDDYTIVDGNLWIMRVRPEDAGTYMCQAQNQYGRTEAPVDLSVGDLVPYFSQDPNSYMSFKPLNDVYLDFDILLSLKPESSEGMVLYNGQFEDGGGDFVCFGLKEGYPEFRFDVGSGPAIIRGNQTLNLNQWHTIKLKRNRKQGEMVVNDRTRYTGESPGYFTGLDLTQNMYLGSVPDYNNIPQAANFKEGFVGSISEVKLKGIDVNMGAEALEIVGVEPYNSCRDTQCQNGGLCMPANNRLGRRCICKQGYTGDRCQEQGMRCHQGACGQNGRCYDLEDGSGFRCICPVGKTGAGCSMDVAIINPFFNRTSFISYPPAENALFSLTIYIEFKPYSLSDGLILYEGNSRDGTGDYMALIQKDGYLEFRFDTGSGPAIVRSRYPLRLNEWTRVTASRTNREGTLIVNSDDPVTARVYGYQRDQGYNEPGFYRYYDHVFKRYRRGASPGNTVGLNLKLPLYLGGPDPTYTVASSVGVTQGFIGCVAELQVNDDKIDLLNDAIESANIVDCGERRLCERQPCGNDATCEDLPGPDYRCICPASHTGKNCEVEINICLTNSPCRNGAPCSITDDGYRCDCPLGFAGDDCQISVDITTAMSFVGDGYVEFDKDLLPHSNSQERQTVSFVIQTTESDGLILWQGEPGGRPLRGGDHFAIGLKNGLVEFRYEMGSGAAVILSKVRVDDGKQHSVSVERFGRSGSLTIDNDRANTVSGESKGFLQMLNADGNIYLGGVSLIGPMTENKYSQNFIGCISDIVIHNKGPLKPQDAERGFNVEPCRG